MTMMDTGPYIAYVNHFKRLYDLYFKEQARQYELQMIDIHVLLFLKNNPGLNTARDIVANRGLSKSNVSTSLEKLRKRGLLCLEGDPENRRVQRIFLKPPGEEIAKKLKKTQTECFEEILAGFSAEERVMLDQCFQRFSENVVSAVKRWEKERRT